MKSVAQLKAELAEAQERERREKVKCSYCSGVGWFVDSTYDRTGVDVRCHRCHGTGLPEDRVNKIIADAVAPFLKPMRNEIP